VPAAAPGLAPGAPPKHNLPLQVTRFFGREAEISQLAQRVAEYRLVTLTGSGGVGKTRLSLRTAETLLADFPDGVWFVALAPLTNPELVPQQVAAAIGLNDSPGQPVLAALTAHLRDRCVLLLLDNCEHLLEACAQLADVLLRASPRLKLIASSREPLGVAGEAVFPIPQLAFPGHGQAVSLDSLREYAALSLLLDRARLVVPDYQPSAQDAVSLAYIVQRLDGIPLAIEMAAARLNVLTAEQLAGRLGDAFRVLSGGSRTSLPRQQTLRATLDWSYRLLSDAERLLLQRLSVFAGSCTLEAAEAVCADPPSGALQAEDVLERLGALVAKSMLLANRLAGQDVRYHLLETVRQYAREKLQDGGEGARMRVRHRDYFLTLADAVARAHGLSDWSGPSAKLIGETDNLRLALDWSVDDPAVVDAFPRLVLGAMFFWPTLSEMVDWSKRALAWCQSHPAVPALLFAQILIWSSGALAQDDPQASLAALKQAAGILRGSGPAGKQSLVSCLFFMSGNYLTLEDVIGALAPLAELEALIGELWPDINAPRELAWMLAWMTSLRAEVALRQGRYLDAIALADEAARHFRDSGQPTQASSIHILALARQNLGQYELARVELLRVLELAAAERGYMVQNRESYALHLLAQLDYKQGNLDRAVEYFRKSIKVANQIPDYNIIAANVAVAAGIAARRGQPARAAKLSGAAHSMITKQSRKLWEEYSLDNLLPGWRDGPEGAALQNAYAAGQALPTDEAVTLALADY
jgi:non-specific serine/threonine protein kinase